MGESCCQRKTGARGSRPGRDRHAESDWPTSSAVTIDGFTAFGRAVSRQPFWREEPGDRQKLPVEAVPVCLQVDFAGDRVSRFFAAISATHSVNSEFAVL